MSNFVERFAKLREKKNASYPTIAREIGVSIRALKYYGSGEREPSMSVLVALSKFFDVPSDYLIGAGLYGQLEEHPEWREPITVQLKQLGNVIGYSIPFEEFDDITFAKFAAAIIKKIEYDEEKQAMNIFYNF